MLNYEHESLFTRPPATSATSHRCWSQPEPGGRDLCHLSANHQAVSQSPTRDRPRFAKSDPRPPCCDRSRIAGGSERAIRTLSRCQARRALPPVGRKDRYQGESCFHQSCQSSSGLDTKKKTIRASEQNETARAAWREQVRALLSSDLVFVDETGSHIAMTPLYAYAPRGERAYGKVPRNYGAIMTLIASLSMQGMGEALILDGAADGATFELYVEQILAPSLHAGQIVILDNLNIHRGPRVKQAIEARG